MKIRNIENLVALIEKRPNIPSAEIQVLYENDHWDGPLEGVCVWRGSEYYFLTSKSSLNEDAPRKFVLIELTPKQKGQEAYWHRLFAEHVSKQKRFGSTLGPEIETKGRENWTKFYERHEEAEPIEILPEQVVGWFEM